MNFAIRRPVLLLFLALALGSGSMGQRSGKPIPVGIKVEAEGPQGMWAQSASDLTPAELRTLESSIRGEIQRQENVKIVPLDYPDDYIAVVVVAAQLPNGAAGHWCIASSAITIATKGGKDELVTHDVLGGPNATALAKAVGFQFASIRLRAAVGLWK